MFQIASRELLDMEKAEGKALVGNQQSGGGPGGPEGALQIACRFFCSLDFGRSTPEESSTILTLTLSKRIYVAHKFPKAQELTHRNDAIKRNILSRPDRRPHQS
jgi:hypothetical protein